MATPTKRVARQIPRQRDEDEDVAPPSKFKTPPVEDDDEAEEEEAPTATIRRGFSAARQTADSTSPFAQAFKLDENAQIVAFLADKPYAGYARHWIERASTDSKGKKGKSNRPYTCLTSVGMGGIVNAVKTVTEWSR